MLCMEGRHTPERAMSGGIQIKVTNNRSEPIHAMHKEGATHLSWLQANDQNAQTTHHAQCCPQRGHTVDRAISDGTQ